jgi:hypothetical protein
MVLEGVGWKSRDIDYGAVCEGALIYCSIYSIYIVSSISTVV